MRAASLNHLDVWVRKGLPSVPKPRILGADGAGVVEALGDGRGRLRGGRPRRAQPGARARRPITVIGEHTDGVHAELVALPAAQIFPLDDALSGRRRRRFRSSTRRRTACS